MWRFRKTKQPRGVRPFRLLAGALVAWVLLAGACSPNPRPAGPTAIPTLAPGSTVTLVSALPQAGATAGVPSVASTARASSAVGVVNYQLFCICHGNQGQGKEAPALRGSAILQGMADQALFTTIVSGLTGTKMPAWSVRQGGPWNDAEINDVVAYLRALQGLALASALPQAKEAQPGGATPSSAPSVTPSTVPTGTPSAAPTSIPSPGPSVTSTGTVLGAAAVTLTQTLSVSPTIALAGTASISPTVALTTTLSISPTAAPTGTLSVGATTAPTSTLTSPGPTATLAGTPSVPTTVVPTRTLTTSATSTLTGTPPAVATIAQTSAPPPAQPATVTTAGGPSPAGDVERGRLSFGTYCAYCHGPQGVQGFPNPGSADGVVPALVPIPEDLDNADPNILAASLDQIIAHGSMPAGPSPWLLMAPYGDEKLLTQQQIADMVAYIVQQNKAP